MFYCLKISKIGQYTQSQQTAEGENMNANNTIIMFLNNVLKKQKKPF